MPKAPRIDVQTFTACTSIYRIIKHVNAKRYRTTDTGCLEAPPA